MVLRVHKNILPIWTAYRKGFVCRQKYYLILRNAIDSSFPRTCNENSGVSVTIHVCSHLRCPSGYCMFIQKARQYSSCQIMITIFIIFFYRLFYYHILLPTPIFTIANTKTYCQPSVVTFSPLRIGLSCTTETTNFLLRTLWYQSLGSLCWIRVENNRKRNRLNILCTDTQERWGTKTFGSTQNC